MRYSVRRVRACLLVLMLVAQLPAAAWAFRDYLSLSQASVGTDQVASTAVNVAGPHPWLSALAPLSVLALICMSAGLETFIAREVSRVTSGARRLASGDLSTAVPQSVISEVQSLSDSVEAIVRAKQQRIAEGAATLASLRQSETRFRELVDQIHDGVYQHTLDGQDLFVNHRLACMLGYESADELRRSFAWDTHMALADREKFMAEVQQSGELINVQRVLRRRDGGAITVLESARLVRDERGMPAYYQGTMVDITERQRIEAELEQSQRLEAVGRLASGVAHDFNNLLTVIFACVDEARDKVEHGESAAEIREEIREIQAAGERAAALTRQLLAFSRKQVLQPRVLDLNDAVAGVEQLVRRLIGEDIALETIRDSALQPVMLDPGQLEQVIVNLAANARDAMPQGGRLTIWTAVVRLTAPERHSGFTIPPGEYAQLSIQDSGSGMTAEVRDRIFEPFFSTKGNRGTGLGLATVYGIVKQSEGFIVVDSEPGQGTTFRLYFPVTTSAAEEIRIQEADSKRAGGTQTLLVVEDEEAVRTLVAAGLRRSGYNVVEASRPDQALELAGAMERLDMVLTDLVLPDMNGRALAERVQQSRPETRVLYMSGYADVDMIARGMLTPDACFLQKPFSWRALTSSVQGLLSGTEGSQIEAFATTA